MEIFKDFGIDPILLIAQIINFAIILYLLKRFMYKPVLSILKKRQEDIEEGIKKAEEAGKKLEEANAKETQILQKANDRAEKIINDAKTEALELRIKAEEVTKKETEKMFSQAREQIEQESKIAEERLTARIGTIAIALLEKSLTGLFGEKEQKAILKKATARLETK